METTYVPPPGAERTIAAALILLAAHDPEAVADLLERNAISCNANAAERAPLFAGAALILRRGGAPALWTRIRGVLGLFAATWREAVLETDLELEARELERRAREPESHGKRRGRVALGPLVVLGLLVVAVFMLSTAGAGDELLVRWIADGLVVVLGALATLDLTLAHWRARRARAELAALEPEPLPRPVVAPRSSGLVLWFEREDGNADRLLDVRDLEPIERVRVVLQRKLGSSDGLEHWRDTQAWRVLPSGALEREEREA